MAEGGLKQPGNFFLSDKSENPSDASRSWTAWLQQYDFYMLATEKNKKAEEIQIATLLTILGSQGQELFRNFDLTNEDRKKIAKVKEAFTNHFSPRVKEEFERYKFYSRVQKPGETFESLLTSIQALIATCNFHADEKDKALRDRIVIGITSDVVREELLNEDGELTLKRCIQVCQRSEATKSYLSQMSEPLKVNELSQKGQKQHINTNSNHHTPKNGQQRRQAQQVNRSSNNNMIKNCKYCGSNHPRRQCPAFGKICMGCSGKNHFEKVCKSKGKKPVSHASEVTFADEVTCPDDVCYAATSTSPKSAKEWFITVTCDTRQLKIKVDTGASCNVMPKSVYDTLPTKPALRKHEQRLLSYSGHNLPVNGKASLLFERDNDFSVHEFIIVDSGTISLLGLPSSIAMGLVNPIGSVNIASEYPRVFEGLGKLNTKHVLRLKEQAKPVIQSPRRQRRTKLHN